MSHFRTFKDADWVRNFRVSRDTFSYLCEQLRPSLAKRSTNMREPISVEMRVGISLWALGTTSDMRTIGELMGVSKSSVSNVLFDVVTAIVQHLKLRYICFPKGAELERVVNSFKEKWGFPNCGGAIDGSHIPILSPVFKHKDYFNRKGWHSIILQAVVNDRYQFTDVYVGWPGSVHDARVLANSSIYKRGENGSLFGNTCVQVGNELKPVVLLGDPAYPLRPWLMKGYINNGALTKEQKKFNYYLSRSRVTVENAFGRLKGRWRCLSKRLDLTTKRIPLVVTACCILHNLCEERNEVFQSDWMFDNDDGDMQLSHHSSEHHGISL